MYRTDRGLQWSVAAKYNSDDPLFGVVEFSQAQHLPDDSPAIDHPGWIGLHTGDAA